MKNYLIQHRWRLWWKIQLSILSSFSNVLRINFDKTMNHWWLSPPHIINPFLNGYALDGWPLSLKIKLTDKRIEINSISSHLTSNDHLSLIALPPTQIAKTNKSKECFDKYLCKIINFGSARARQYKVQFNSRPPPPICIFIHPTKLNTTRNEKIVFVSI